MGLEEPHGLHALACRVRRVRAEVGEARERDLDAVVFIGADRQVAEGGEIEAVRFGKAHDDGDAAAALDEGPGLLTREGGGDDAIDFVGVEIEALQGLPLRGHLQGGHAAQRLELHVAAAGNAAEERGMKGQFVITLARSLIEPFLQYSTNRDLRERAFKLWTKRGEMGGASDNRAIVAEMLKLRVALLYKQH